MMNKVFTDNGWEDYTYWQTEDKKTLKKINNLIKDIDRNGNEGIGKPEPLTGNLTGFWSRRINDKDRLIYKIDDKKIEFSVSAFLCPVAVREFLIESFPEKLYPTAAGSFHAVAV